MSASTPSHTMDTVRSAGGRAENVVADAWACARSAAERHGVRVVGLREVAEHHAAAALLCRIWRADSPDSLISASLIKAMEHSGNYVAGAYDGEHLVGVAIGFFGTAHLHSHIAGVAPTRQGGGIGYALKLHQRAWSLGRGITEVRWTFDPLVGRNARFNLRKLGALATGYLPDFYGPMTDGVNAGDSSDRLYVTWRLTSDLAVDAAHGTFAEAAPAVLRAARVLLDRVASSPEPAAGLPADGQPLLVAVPDDIEELRASDPALARRWRYAVRDALTRALAAGYRITGIGRDGFYVLEVVP